VEAGRRDQLRHRYDMVHHGDYVVPRLGGVAAPERPPLFYALAAGAATTLAPALSLHDAARVANAICLGLALCCWR
jgi:4-amino-4-deoxy-L-arabinose transferase-like glycosyltransferase